MPSPPVWTGEREMSDPANPSWQPLTFTVDGPARTYTQAELDERVLQAPIEAVAKWRERQGGPWDEADVLIFKLFNLIWNDGFEAAHALRKCGHSVGDFRDPNYIVGKNETYTGKESCIGCETVRQARKTARLEEARFRPHDWQCFIMCPEKGTGCNCGRDRRIAGLERRVKETVR